MKEQIKIKKIKNIYGNYWIVSNKHKIILGTFSYYKPWKCMTYKQHNDCHMSPDCLRTLAHKMESTLKRIAKNKQDE